MAAISQSRVGVLPPASTGPGRHPQTQALSSDIRAHPADLFRIARTGTINDRLGKYGHSDLTSPTYDNVRVTAVRNAQISPVGGAESTADRNAGGVVATTEAEAARVLREVAPCSHGAQRASILERNTQIATPATQRPVAPKPAQADNGSSTDKSPSAPAAATATLPDASSRRKTLLFGQSESDVWLVQRLTDIGAPIQVPDFVYIGFKPWTTELTPEEEQHCAELRETRKEASEGHISEPDPNGLDRSVRPAFRNMIPTQLLCKLADHRMHALTPKFEHCNIWIVWIIDGHKKCLLFNTSGRHPSIVRVPKRCRQLDLVFLALPEMAANPDMPLDALRWCLGNEDKPFNNFGFWINHLPIPDMFKIDTHGKSFYCAEEVSMLLKVLTVKGFEDFKTWQSTPDQIYNTLVEVTGITTPTMLDVRRTQFSCTSRNTVKARKQTAAPDGAAQTTAPNPSAARPEDDTEPDGDQQKQIQVGGISRIRMVGDDADGTPAVGRVMRFFDDLDDITFRSL